jgi:hypothetical protein
MLEDIQMNWQEVNKRIQQRAQLLQTLQITNESAREKAKQFGLTTLEAVNQANLGATINASNDSAMELGSRVGSLKAGFMNHNQTSIQSSTKQRKDVSPEHRIKVENVYSDSM